MQPLVVFDLDGTLVETAPDLVDTLNLILAQEGFPAVPYDEARMMVGAGAKALLERGLRTRMQEIPAELLDRLFENFLKHYADNIANCSRPFPGVEKALDELSAAGFRLAVCTNKLEWLSRKLLDELNLTTKFAAICGQDTFSVKKPDPEVLRQTIAAAQGDGQATVMIGDSVTDITLARRAGVPVIAVNFGYTDRPIETYEPDIVIGHFDELTAAVGRLPGFAGRFGGR
jgi:phosphoglycolate phosphatase